MEKFYFQRRLFSIAKLLSIIFFVTLFQNAFGQLTGTRNIPGDYATLALAITDLNTQGVGAGGVTLNLVAGNPQTAPSGGYVIGGAGSLVLTTASMANPIVIQGNGNSITAFGGQTAGLLTDAVFKLIGADWTTISGFTLLENGSNTTTDFATNNMTEWGIALLYVSTTDGAQNNTIQANTIDLNRTYANTFGIYSNSTHSSTAVTVTATATTANGGNHNIKIYGNTIQDVNMGIVVVGPTAAADHNDILEIGATAPNANTIQDYGTTATFSGYVNVSGTVNGILVRNTKNFNVSYNSVTSSNGGTTVGTLNGIQVPAFSNAPTGTFTNSINNNSISVKSGVIAGAINGINVLGTSASTTSTININSNDFHNCGHTVAGTGAITFLNQSGTHLNTNILNNTFTNMTVNTTGSVSFISNNATRPVNAVCNVNNNSIVTGFNKTGAGGTVQFYLSNATSLTTVTETNDSNNFSNMTFTGATTINGWQSTDGSTTSPFGPVKVVTNNTFSNITGGTSEVKILQVAYSNNNSSSNNVSGNVVSNINVGGIVTGITTNAGRQNFFSNTISTITSSGATAVNGFSSTGGTTHEVYGNKIYDISSTNAGGTVNGILISGSVANQTINVYNNLIGDLRAEMASSTTDVVRGINVAATGTTSTYNVSFNTVYLNTASTGTNFSTSAIFHAASATSTTATLNLRNNILVNLSTANGSGVSVVYRRSTTALNNYGSVSNNNLLYAGTPGATKLIFYDGTNSDQTLGAYITRVTPRDDASITENPNFLSTTGSSVNFLHIDPSIATAIESGGITVTGITTDYDGNTRNVTTPDIGADEFAGMTLSCTGTPAPSNAVVDVSLPACNGQTFTLSLDVSYIAVDYQWQSSPDNSSWSNISGATFSTHITSTSTSTYYRAVITCPSSGMSTNSASVFVSIFTALSGTYTIDNTSPSVGTNYNNFVDAVAALNCRGVSAPVVFNVTPGQTFTSSDSLNITATGTSTNTIIFQKNGAGTNPKIQRLGNSGTTNYILRIGGGDYITFNGIDFQQTGTSASNWVEYGIYLQNTSVTEGAKNNTFKNGVVTMTNANTASKGVYVHSPFTPTALTGTNSTNKFLNMTVLNSYEGYRIGGATNTFPDDGNEINTEMSGLSTIQTLGDGTASASLYGVFVAYQTNFKIRNTEISSLAPGGTSLAYGIALQSSTANTAEISGNLIHDITGSGVVTGIQMSSGDSVNIFDNTIYALSSATATSSAVRGMDIGGTGLGANIYNNKIYDLSSAGLTTTSVGGIEVGSGNVFNIYNNMISDLSAPASTNTSGGTKGISTTSTAAQTVRIYYNTVLLTDVGSVAGYTSAGFYNSSATPTIDFRNNIIVNKSDVSTGTRAVAYWKSATTINQHVDTDNNLYYSGSPSAKNLLYYDGTNAAQTISAIQAISGMSPREAFSVTEDVDFDPVTGGIIRPDVTTGTLVESGGQLITGYNTDFENQPRQGSGGYSGTGTAPDIGADEFEGTLPSCSGAPAPSNAMVDLTPPLCPGVSFTTSLSTAYSGTDFQWQSSPDNAAWTNIGGAISATYNTTATTTTYYRAVITCPASGMSTGSGSVLVSVHTMLNGTYTIDNTMPTSGTNYNNFSAAIADLHCRGLNGPVVFNVTAGQVFSSSDSLNILATGTSTNTITFQRSGVGANPLVQRLGTGSATNYILRIGGGDYFTFDGINFEQTGSSAADYVEFGIYIQNASATNGAKNNTFKNGIVSMSPDVATTKGVYVHASPSATNVSGTNSSNRFLNMTVQNSFEGYRFSGTSATYQDDGNEIGTELSGLSSVQTLGNGTVTGILGGINATYQQNFAIRNTEISNITAGGTSTVYGILLSTSASDTTEVSGNHIHNVSGGGTVYGLSATSGDSLIVFNNNVYTLSTTTTTSSFVRGIDVGGTGMKSSIYDNKVYDLSSTGATTTSVIGMDIGTGIHNVINNMISDLRAPASTTTTGGTRGISITGGTSGATHRIYYNTVLLTDIGTVAGYTSAGIHNSSTTPTLDLRNNIIINKSDVTTGTRAVAFWKTGTTDNVSNACNNNLYYAGTPGAKNLIYYDGTTPAQTITDYKAMPAITPAENYSVTEDVVFAAVASGIIRPDQTVATLVESSGQVITQYQTDFENDARGPYPLGGQANGGGYTPDLGADEGDFTFVLPPVPDCATLNSPANGTMNLCSYQDVILSWTAAVTGGTPSLGYDIYLGTSPTPPFLANTLMTSYTATGLMPNATYYWKIVPKNPSGDAAGCTTYTFTTADLSVTSTTPGSRCGVGTVTLGATGNGGTLNWYAQPTGGTALGSGTSFVTPIINSTTPFYVGALASGSSVFTGRIVPVSGAGTVLTTYGQDFTVNQGVTLNSVRVISTTGTSITVSLYNSTGSTQLFTTGAVSANPGDTVTVNLGWNINPGTYRLIANGMTLNFIRENSSVTYPIALSTFGQINGFVSSITGSVTTSSSYYWFYKWSISPYCESDRTAVTATVTPADPITITPSAVNRCPSDPATSITASSTYSYNYTWSPSTGLNTPNGPTVLASPSTSTTYTVLGDDGTCANTATVEVIVNNPPSSPVASATPNPVCEGNSVSLSSSATAPAYIVSSIAHAPLSGSSTSIFITGDDTISAAITLPFTFNYFGVAKTQMRVSSNGWITFNASETSTTNTVVTIPAAGAPNDAIYVLLDDVIVTGSGSPEVRYFTTGSTPNRTLVVEYSNLKFWNSGLNDGLFNAQLHLKESTGNIEIHILDANDPVTNTKTIGVENSTGTQAIAPPGRNNTIFNITNASPLAWRFVPNTILYSWSGPGGYTSNMQNPTIGTATAAHAGLYTVTISDNSGCSSTATVNLGVNTSVVSSTSDAGANSLRDVIACAAPGSTITFAPALSGQTITLTTGEIAINKNLTISGLGAVNLFVSGNNASRIFRVLSGNTVNIEDISLINAASVTNGGAFWNEGTMTIENVIISGSTQNGLPKGFTGGPLSITEFLGTSSIND